MVRVWLLTISLLFVNPIAHADVSEVTATVDRNPVTANQSFVLTVTVNDDVPNESFSPSKLLKDFVVGRTSVSRQTSIINGSLSKQTQFTTVLIPQAPGEYRIPPVTIEGVSSAPISLTVLEAGSVTDNQQKIAFLEAQVDSQTVYLQQPITYVARLFLGADLNKGNLIPPQAEHADIRQIGRDEESTQMVNGRRYKVYQRVYQITPSQSGPLTITGARFNGEVFTQGQSSIFSSFSNTRPVSTMAETIDVQVKPIPDSWTGNWLPSELVSVSQSVTPEKDSFAVGEPITLSYMLTAVGVKPEQLPKLNPDFPEAVRVYPDGEETDQFTRNGVVISQKTVSFALVPNEAGSLVIPPLSIPWFNTKTGSATTAQTQALSFSVTLPEGMQPAETDATEDQTTLQETQTIDEGKPPALAPVDLAWWKQGWLIVLLTFVLTLSLLINGYLYRRFMFPRHRKITTAKNNKEPELNKDKNWRAFQSACKENNASAARNSLLKWSNSYFTASFNSLTELSQYLSIETECEQLQKSLYEPGADSWKGGKELYKKVKESLGHQHNNTPKDRLPPLYGN